MVSDAVLMVAAFSQDGFCLFDLVNIIEFDWGPGRNPCAQTGKAGLCSGRQSAPFAQDADLLFIESGILQRRNSRSGWRQPVRQGDLRHLSSFNITVSQHDVAELGDECSPSS